MYARISEWICERVLARRGQAIFARPGLSEQRTNSQSVLRDLTKQRKQTNKKRGAVRFKFRCCVSVALGATGENNHRVAGPPHAVVRSVRHGPLRDCRAYKNTALIYLPLAKPPRIRATYRLAHVQGKKSLNAPNNCPDEPPEQNDHANSKMDCEKPHKKIQKPDPKRCYLKLKVRLGNSIRAVSLKISDYHTHKDRYPREKPNQIQNVDG
jgi:hypothetical protein